MCRLLLAFLLYPLMTLMSFAQHSTAILDLPNQFSNTNVFNFGIQAGPVTAAALSQSPLSTAGDGSFIRVSDGLIGSNPCTGGSTGTWALRVGSQWNCSLIGGATGGTVTGITTASPLTGCSSPCTSTATLGMANSGVTAGSYTNTNLTVDVFGRITAASNGSSGTGTVTGTGTSGNLALWAGSSSIGNSDFTNTAGSVAAVGINASLTGNSAFSMFAAPSGTCNLFIATFPIVNDKQGCQGYYVKQTNGSSATATTVSGMFSNVASAGSANLQIGAAGLALPSVNSTRIIGVYGEANQLAGITLINASGVFAYAENSAVTTLAVNDGLTAQTGVATTETTTKDSTIHVVAPFPTLGTMTQHAGVRVDAQTIGVAMQLDAEAFSALPACSATYAGAIQTINDSTTTTWGATITGGGANYVLGMCDSVAWTVVGK